VLITVAACSSGGATSALPNASNSPASSSLTVDTSASVDQDSPQAKEALTTYRAMWADLVTVEQTMNDQNLLLTDHLTGAALSYFQRAIHTNKLDGYVAKGEPTLLHPAVKEITGSGDSAQALVQDCVDEDPFKLFTSDGTLVTASANGRHMTQALVTRQSDGSLKVAAFVFNPAGSC
jgi:hypothetical protein